MSLLRAIQAKVREQTNGRMYVETEIGGKKLQATVDTEHTPYIWQRNLLMRVASLQKGKRLC